MSTYHFGNSSLVNEIKVRRSAGGGTRIFLFAQTDLTPEKAREISSTLTQQSWQCVATEYKGRACLEVRGARTIDVLEPALRKGGYLAGSYTRISKEEDVKFSAKEKFRNNMLLVSGVLNVLADIGILGYGELKKHIDPKKNPLEDQMASVAYTSGSVALALFGRGDKSDHHVREISQKLRQKMLNEGLTLTNDSAAFSFTADSGRGVRGRTTRFLHKHPSEIFNTLTATAGGLITAGALRSHDSQTKVLDSVLGASTLTAGLTAALVKEKAPDPSRPPPKGFFGKVGRWIQERPNRIAGGGYFISTVVHASEAVRYLFKAGSEQGTVTLPYMKGGLILRKSTVAYLAYGMRLMFAGFNMLAEITMCLSSKGHGNGVKSDSSIDDTAYAIVADTIIRQPVATQERLIHDLSADFLAKPDVLGGDAAKIEDELRKRVKDLASNPWAIVNRTVGQKEPAENLTRDTHWQEKALHRGEQAIAI